MSNENEKKVLVEFLKETKTASLIKMNNATYKLSTLLAFILGCIIFTIKNLPSTPPDLNDFYIAFILINYFIGCFVVFFHFFNLVFRREQTWKNATKNWNELERAYMKPAKIAGMMVISLFVTTIIMMIYLCFHFRFQYWRMTLQYIPIFYIIFFMTRNLIKGVSEDRLTTNLLKGLIAFLMLMLLIFIPFYNLPTIINLIFEHKLIALYSFYFVGCYWAIFLISKVLSYRIIYTWIEDFYNDIHLYDIETEQIKAKLKSEFSSGRNIETIVYSRKINDEHRYNYPH